MKTKSVSSVITISKEASARFVKILREPATSQQKKSLSESLGTYSYYQKKWLKK